MQNSTKTWQEEEQQFINQSANDINKELSKTWQEELNKDAYFDEKIGEMVLEIKYITKIVADLRKRDMEALIEIMKDKFAPSDNFLTIDIIKDYYEN